MINHSYLILLFPLLSFVLGGLWLGRRHWFAAALFAIAMAGAAFAWSLGVAWLWYDQVHGTAAFAKPLTAWRIHWLPLDQVLQLRQPLNVDLEMILDPLSVLMLVVVTAIALVVSIYSVGYMKDDPAAGRFFALLSLFVFSMLGLVISGNVFQMYMFWELVGVSSYLLIGFWYHKPSAVAASKKAFIITRFADSFFLLGIILVAYFAKSFDFAVLNSPDGIARLTQPVDLGFAIVPALPVAALCIFAGGWGKSAMFPLHVWLPDAMEGPTPVSSIIHSATMVVAGVYLTARLFPLFAAAGDTLTVVRTVGIITAVGAAVIACTQKDIKRILAFSTLSQLGYMMFALGVAATVSGTLNPLGYTAATFHIFTHAFFKCMLFLGAGAIIHTVHSNDLDDMGGLRKRMPITYWSLLLATLAIAGIPPLSGFWSKDAIILAALQSGHPVVAWLGLATGGLTAFYMFRLFFLAFHGTSRTRHHGDAHDSHGHDAPHEERWMTTAIVLLTVPTVFAGWLSRGLFHHLALPDMLLPEYEGVELTWLPYVASAIGVAGLALAFALYGRAGADAAAALRTDGRPAWYRVVLNKFYFDELYLFITRRVLIAGLAAGIKWVDTHVVDRAVDFTWQATAQGGRAIRALQNGNLPLYLGATLFGLFLLHLLAHLPL